MSPVVRTRKHVEVTIKGARGLKKVAWIGVNQPVAVAWVSPRAARSTHVALNGGSNPMWNQRLLVPVNEDLQRSVSWVLKVQVSHHVGFLCCLHRPIGTATIPVTDILNASNSRNNGDRDDSDSSSNGDHGIGSGGIDDGTNATTSFPHTDDPQPLPLLTYPLLGAFNRQQGFLDLTVRLLKVIPHSHPPFLSPFPSHSPPTLSISSPHSSPSSSSKNSLHEDEESHGTSLPHTSSSSSSSKHSFHEAGHPLSPPASPPPLSNSSPTLKNPPTPKALPPSKSSPPPSSHSTLKDPSTTISPLPPSKASPFTTLPLPPTTTTSLPIKPSPPPPPPPRPPVKRASLVPITAPIPMSPTSGPFPTKPTPPPPPPPPPPPTKKASLPRPIPPPHNTVTNIIALPTPKKPTTAMETTSPIITTRPYIPKPPTKEDPFDLTTSVPTTSKPKDFPHSSSILPSLPSPTTPLSLTSPVELPNPKPKTTLAFPISPPPKTIETPTHPTSTMPLWPSSTFPYPTPPTRNPPPPLTPSSTSNPVPTTPQFTLIHISTTTIFPIPTPPMDSSPSPSHVKKDVPPHDNTIFPSPIGEHGSGENLEGSTSSSTTKSKIDGMHEETSHDDGSVPMVGAATLPFTHAENRRGGDESEQGQESLPKDDNDPFLSPYDDPFFDLEHLYSQPQDYSEPFYIDSTNVYPSQEEMEAYYHHPFESSRNEKI